MEAPVVITSMAWPPRSAWIAGSTSHRTHSWNWLSSHMRYSGEPSFVIIARPATLSTEYSLTWPSASSGPHASIRPNRSISSASPPADGKTSTGRPNVPHRATVMSVLTRSEYHRDVVFTPSFIEELLRPWEDPGQSFPQPVAPILPAVPVPGLDVADGHPGGLERRDHGPVADDQRLVDPAADEQHHRLERRPTAVVGADVGEHERAGLQQQRAVGARVAVGRRERRDGAEARAHQAPGGRRAREWELGLQLRHELGGQVTGVGRRVRVFGQPVTRVHERGDGLGHVQPVDEVVEHG